MGAVLTVDVVNDFDVDVVGESEGFLFMIRRLEREVRRWLGLRGFAERG